MTTDHCDISYRYLIFVMLQRPNAKDLLKSRFIRKAGRTAFLVDAIENYKRWKQNSNESDSDSSDDEAGYVYLLLILSNVTLQRLRTSTKIVILQMDFSHYVTQDFERYFSVVSQ